SSSSVIDCAWPLEWLFDQPKLQRDVAQVAKVAPDAKATSQKLHPRVLLASQDRVNASRVAEHLDQGSPVSARADTLRDAGLALTAFDQVSASPRSRQSEDDIAALHRAA